MPRLHKGLGVSLSHEVIADLESYATASNITRAEAIRVAISVGLPLLKLGAAINTRRTLAILEHTQLALSLMIERQYPEDARQLLTMALRNVDDYHA